MRCLGISGLALLALISTADAQDGREAALQEIARALEEIKDSMPSQSEMMAYEASAIQERIDAAVGRVEALKDYLADNEYVRVSGFELGVPIGIAVSFEFLD